jgi:hypothetical protein
MASIFIWKSDKPNTSKNTIRCYIGSNWILEDNDFSSKSFKLLEQNVISGFDNTVITYRAISMPKDWVGSELLEVSVVPYEIIKQDSYGTLEMIGNWMRFTCNNEIDLSHDSLLNELNNIKKWTICNTVQQFDKIEKEKEKEKGKEIKLHHNTKKINKYNKYDTYNIHNINNNNNTQQFQSISNMTHQTVEQNFQQFLVKYSIPIQSYQQINNKYGHSKKRLQIN